MQENLQSIVKSGSTYYFESNGKPVTIIRPNTDKTPYLLKPNVSISKRGKSTKDK